MTGFAEERAPYDAPMTKARFLRWVQDQPRGRYELTNGKVVMHPGGSKRHSWICANFIRLLGNELAAKDWAVGTTDLAVDIGDDIRYPDAIVERLLDDGTALSTDRPVLLIEVLSPSSVGTDMTIKLAEYTSLPSLEAYIVASQDEAICWVWQRHKETRAFPELPEEVKGCDNAIAISTPKTSLPLSEIYRGIATI